MKEKIITTGSSGQLGKSLTISFLVFEIIAYLFILLFVYAAWSKIGDFGSFSKAFIHSDYIGQHSKLLAIAILVAEIGISILLIIPATRRMGLLAALLLLLLFTGYLVLMFLKGNEMPCGCGGIISSMSWSQHLWFNSGCILVALFALLLNKK
ncbi:hypothetical protein CPT03_13400 [Pedobacter ginsengisoli]|uniref:Methylamine utilisation protein MauE domain-containing protein n=1 Tax=Pedobacter ginsengisoli TaxID=363852 RepID=A0A2D1U718_9SPHI|nr:MauE/DoxX family redox-associated membrane protein [Pedobacter ginsengisoli]ATP57393.1 hypothetical protein CPT03_13400 [Pedobacter ginsengisoli]